LSFPVLSLSGGPYNVTHTSLLLCLLPSWQQALAREEFLRHERKTRREVRHLKKEQEKIVHLKRELEAAKSREKGNNRNTNNGEATVEPAVEVIVVLPRTPRELKKRPISSDIISSTTKSKKAPGIGGKLRVLMGKRAMSTDKLQQQGLPDVSAKLSTTPSMPEMGAFSHSEGVDLRIDTNDDDGYDGDGNEGNRDDRSVADSTEGGIII
jgi:hypothetical protein